MEINQGNSQEISSSERQLIVAAYQAFNRRDIDAVVAMMTPDVDWPNGWEGGYVKGHLEVRAYWVRQWQMIDPFVEPVYLTKEASGRITVSVHQFVRDLLGNILFDGTIQHVYQFEGSLIRSMEIRLD